MPFLCHLMTRLHPFFFLNDTFVAVSTYQIFFLSLTVHKNKAFSTLRAGHIPESCLFRSLLSSQ